MPEDYHTDAPPILPLPRPSILRSASTSSISVASCDSKTSSITFAPLPDIEARKRRSTRPIGVAGRAEMLRKSRRPLILQNNTYDDDYIPEEEDDDIPLPDLGKLVKGLWRSVSRGTKEKHGRHQTAHSPNTNASAIGKRIHQPDEEDDAEGGVWIEEVTWSPSPSERSSRTIYLTEETKRNSQRHSVTPIDTTNGLEGPPEKRQCLESAEGGMDKSSVSHNGLGAHTPITETVAVA